MRHNLRLLGLVIVVTLLLLLATEATAAHYGYRPLSRGMRGEDVEELQFMLRKLKHYYGPVDGVFGADLEKSIKVLQKSYNLPQTGKVEGKLLEITSTLYAAYVSGESEALDVNPDHLKRKGNIQLAVHTVSRGDTVFAIARKYQLPASTILRINNLSNPNLIRPGQKLYVLKYR